MKIFLVLLLEAFMLIGPVYGKDVPDRDYRIAIVLFDEGEYGEAENKFSTVIEKGDLSIPEAAAYVVNSYYGRASCRIEQGRKFKENKNLEEALKKYDDAYTDLSVFKDKFEELQDTLKLNSLLYDEMEKHFVNVSEQMVQLAGEAGDICVNQGKYAKAVEWYDKGLSYIDPRSSTYGDILYAKADAVFQLGEYEETLRLLSKFENELSSHKLASNAMFYAGDIHRTMSELSSSDDAKRKKHITEARDAYGRVVAGSLEGADVDLVKMALLEKGRCEKKLGRMDEALVDFQKIQTYYPNTQYEADADLEIGDYYFAAKDYNSATDNFNRAMKVAKSLDLDDRMGISNYWIGWSYFREASRIDVESSPEMTRRSRNLYEQSINAFQDCVKSSEKFWKKEGKETQTAKELEGYSSESLFMIGRGYQGLQRWDEAIKAFGQIPSVYKEWWLEGLAEVALSMERKGDEAGAMAKWNELKREISAARVPNIELRLLMARAEGILDLQRYAEAEESYREIILKYPGSDDEPRARVSLGLALFKQGKSDEAIQEFTTMLSKYGRDENLGASISEALFWKGYLTARTGAEGVTSRVNLEQAIRDYRELINRFPDSMRADDAQFEIGFITYSLGSFDEKKYSEAVVEYSRLLQKYTASEYSDDALFEIGRCYRLLGNEAKEEEYLRKLISDYSSSELADNSLLRIAEIHFERAQKAGSREERQIAENTYDELISKYPGTESEAIAHFQTGSISYRFDGNFQTASMEFAKCAGVIDGLLNTIVTGGNIPLDLDVSILANLLLRSTFWQAESTFQLAKQIEEQAQPPDAVKRAYGQAHEVYSQLLARKDRLMKDFPEKSQDLDEIMEGEQLNIPIIIEAQYMMGRCLYKEGDMDGAEDILQSIKNPEKLRLKAELIIAFIAYDSGNLNEAKAILEKWQDSETIKDMADEYKVGIQVLTAKIALSLGNFSEAKTQALDTWALHQSVNGLWEESAYIVAKCYLQQNDMERARSWFDKLEKSSSERWRIMARDAISKLSKQ